MAIFILLGLQAAAALSDPAIPADFDLSKLPTHEEPLDVTGSRDCRSSDGMEIVVCGRRGEQRYRLRALPDGDYPPEEPVRAEIGVFGNSKVAIEAESATVGSGTSALQTKRAMIRLKTPF